MSWLSKAIRSVNNFVADVDPLARNMPEFQSQKKAFEAGNWDKPFGSEASGWDFLGAGAPGQITSGGKTVGGALDPEKPEDRAKGRAVGTAIADYWTAGLFSQIFAPKPEGITVETPSGPQLFNSLTSPSVPTPTHQFVAEASSVTPAQVAQAARTAQLKRWTWYALLFIGALILLKRFNLLKGI